MYNSEYGTPSTVSRIRMRRKGVPALTMDPTHLRSDPLYMKVYTLLKGWILAGRLAPGERIGETALAAELRVSRTPVRDALRRRSFTNA